MKWKPIETTPKDGTPYFVLDLDHDPHTLPALAAYQESCELERPNLARDLGIEIAYMSMEQEARDE